MKKVATLFLVFVFGCWGCKVSAVSTPATRLPDAYNQKMLFLTFKMYQDSANALSIEILNKIVADGSVRASTSYLPAGNTLNISLKSKTGEVLCETTTEHPLYRNVEYVNDSGNFERKNVFLEEATFFVRLNCPENAALVEIEEWVGKVKTNVIVLDFQ